MPADNGFVPTPPAIADYAAVDVFGATRPGEPAGGGRLLLPGLGTGNLYAGVRRYCTSGENWRTPSFEYPLPECVGVEVDPEQIAAVREQRSTADIDIHEADFLRDPPGGRFDWVLCNPPFVRYNRIDTDDREDYRQRFDLATGKFPLYVPFFEQALRLLKPGGQLTFILPLKALIIGRTEALRMTIRRHYTAFIGYLPPQTFDRTVETVLVTLHKEASPSVEGYTGLWLEPLLPYGIGPVLRRLGVEDLDAGHELYRRRLRSFQEQLRALDRRTTVDASGETPVVDSNTGHQTDLGTWAESPGAG